jgi:hypothetical protein
MPKIDHEELVERAKQAINAVFGDTSVDRRQTRESLKDLKDEIKRGVHGVWHHVSPKHLGRYVDEATFRLNAGRVQIHTLRRLDAIVDATAGKRITYAEVIA